MLTLSSKLASLGAFSLISPVPFVSSPRCSSLPEWAFVILGGRGWDDERSGLTRFGAHSEFVALPEPATRIRNGLNEEPRKAGESDSRPFLASWLTAQEANGKGSRILSAGRRQAETAILPVETARHLILLSYCKSPSAAPGRRLGCAKRSGPRGPNAGRNVLNPNFQRGNTGRGLVVGSSRFCRVGCASRLAKPAE